MTEFEKKLDEFINYIKPKSGEMIKICKQENMVFNNLDDRWQKLAFTFYSEIAEMSLKARQLDEILKELGE